MYFLRFARLLVTLVLLACLICNSKLSAQDKSGLVLPYVPEETDIAMAVHPAALLKSKGFRDLGDSGQKVVRRLVGRIANTYYKLSLTELDGIEQITLVAKARSKDADPSDSDHYDLTIIKTSRNNKDRFDLATHDVEEVIKYKDAEYFKAKRKVQGISGYIWIADEKTIMFTNWQQGIKAAIDQGKKDPVEADWFSRWNSVKDKHFAISISEKSVTLASRDFEQVGAGLPLDFSSLEKIKHITGDFTFGKETHVNINAVCAQTTQAKQLSSFAEQGLELLWKSIKHQQDTAMPPGPGALPTIFADIVQSAKVTTKGKSVSISSKVHLDFEKLNPMFEATYLAFKRGEASKNLRKIAVGFHEYHAANNGFLSSVYVSEQGKKYSWRIEILPYIGEKDLYDQYRFDEEWNSPHNQKVTSRMPDFFRSDSDDQDTTNTSWFLLIGPDGAIKPDGPRNIHEISNADGTSKTIIAIEAKRDMHWAKPADILVDPKKGMPMLGGYHEGGFHVAFADASVHFIDEKIDPKLLWSLFTFDGGERINTQDLRNGDD